MRTVEHCVRCTPFMNDFFTGNFERPTYVRSKKHKQQSRGFGALPNFPLCNQIGRLRRLAPLRSLQCFSALVHRRRGSPKRDCQNRINQLSPLISIAVRIHHGFCNVSHWLPKDPRSFQAGNSYSGSARVFIVHARLRYRLGRKDCAFLPLHPRDGYARFMAVASVICKPGWF